MDPKFELLPLCACDELGMSHDYQLTLPKKLHFVALRREMLLTGVSPPSRDLLVCGLLWSHEFSLLPSWFWRISWSCLTETVRTHCCSVLSITRLLSPKTHLSLCFAQNGTTLYKMNIMLCWRRLESYDWDHKLIRKLSAEVLNQVGSRVIFS